MSAVHRIGVKPRRAGTVAAACATAWAQAGGVAVVAAETGIKPQRLYAAADPDSNGKDQKQLTLREIFRIESELGVTAFSDALVAQRGGVVLDGYDGRDVASLRSAWATATGEATAALLDDRPEAATLLLERSLKLGAALRAALVAKASRR